MYDQKKERNFCLSHKHTSWKDTEQNIPRVRDWLEDVISSAQVMPTCSVFSIILIFFRHSFFSEFYSTNIKARGVHLCEKRIGHRACWVDNNRFFGLWQQATLLRDIWARAWLSSVFWLCGTFSISSASRIQENGVSTLDSVYKKI